MPGLNPTDVCWLLHVHSPAAAAAKLSSSSLVRFAAGNTSTGLIYAETRWPPVRATAWHKLLDNLLITAERKPTAMHRDTALLRIGAIDWHSGIWVVGGQGRRNDIVGLGRHRDDGISTAADASD